MTKTSNLPMDLAEEVLCRVPLTSLRRVRSTCKGWKTLSKSRSFAKKHLGQARLATEKELRLVFMIDFRVYLISVNLENKKNVESFMKPECELISLEKSDQIDICQIYHCDGLLLCISRDYTRLVVWNPYSGQTRWIEPTYSHHKFDRYSYALGYDKSEKRRHKILRFIDLGFISLVEFKIYDFSRDSWRILDITPDRQIDYYDHGVSLKGNTYWFGKESPVVEEGNFLLCFDFTTDKFGPRLPLPPHFEWFPEDTLTLSSVRDEQLAVLFQRMDTFQLEIWVTTKIRTKHSIVEQQALLIIEYETTLKIWLEVFGYTVVFLH